MDQRILLSRRKVVKLGFLEQSETAHKAFCQWLNTGFSKTDYTLTLTKPSIEEYPLGGQ